MRNKPLKVLNLYAGLGGNRKLWSDVDVTAVEIDPQIAALYSKYHPEDNVIVGDAHKYLLDHYSEFDFIWSSIPCPSHSRARFWSSKGGTTKPVYPDFKLYEEIIFLKHFFKGVYVVENVIPYYPMLIPGRKIGRHVFWTNFPIRDTSESFDADINGLKPSQGNFGYDLTGIKLKQRKDKILRNLVNPELGMHIFNSAFSELQMILVLRGDEYDKK